MEPEVLVGSFSVLVHPRRLSCAPARPLSATFAHWRLARPLVLPRSRVLVCARSLAPLAHAILRTRSPIGAAAPARRRRSSMPCCALAPSDSRARLRLRPTWSALACTHQRHARLACWPPPAWPVRPPTPLLVGFACTGALRVLLLRLIWLAENERRETSARRVLLRLIWLLEEKKGRDKGERKKLIFITRRHFLLCV